MEAIYFHATRAVLVFLVQVEDAQEQFDRLQMALLLEDPDSAPFYNAKIRTQRRVSTCPVMNIWSSQLAETVFGPSFVSSTPIYCSALLCPALHGPSIFCVSSSIHCDPCVHVCVYVRAHMCVCVCLYVSVWMLSSPFVHKLHSFQESVPVGFSCTVEESLLCTQRTEDFSLVGCLGGHDQAFNTWCLGFPHMCFSILDLFCDSCRKFTSLRSDRHRRHPEGNPVLQRAPSDRCLRKP